MTLSIAWICWAGLQLPGVPSPTAPRDEAPGTDVTQQAREYNSDKFAPPPVEFPKGHVSLRQLDPSALKASEDGFEIQLPSQAPIPTLTIYNGRVYASGGFHSKEFYCFDAVSGQLIWAVDLDDDGPSAAVCDDGVCVFNTESCTIFAVDASSGEMLWSYWLGDPLMSTPAIAGGRVFTAYPANGGGHLSNQIQSDDQQLQQANQAQAADPQTPDEGKPRPPASHVLACFDLKTGAIVWQRWIDSDVMSAPVAVDGDLYVASFAGTLYRFRQADGQIVSASKIRATSAPVIVGQEVMMTRRTDAQEQSDAAEGLSSLDRQTGQANYTAGSKRAVYLDQHIQRSSKLAEMGAQLDAGNGFAGGAPEAANAQPAAENIGYFNVSTLQAFQGSRILHCGGLNINCPGNSIVCTDAKSGEQCWSIPLDGDLAQEGGFLAAPPAEAGGQVFVSTLKGEVLQINPQDGGIRKRYAIGSPVRFQPVIHAGRLYVGTQDGKIVCVQTGDATLSGWTAWGGNAAHSGVGGK